MRSLFLFFSTSTAAFAHPGHGQAIHLHGFNPELLLLALLAGAWAIIRSK
jgi:hypothetical protein